MQKDLEIGELADAYGALLTERQREILTSYYDYDLSLSEIAENVGITRQAVRDVIVRSGEQLKAYERALGIKRDGDELRAAVERLTLKLDEDGARLVKEELAPLIDGREC